MFKSSHGSHKNKLLEFSTTYFGLFQPEYFHFEYGPDHAKVFLCICRFQRKTTSHEGRTKIEAEQLASQEMLALLEGSIEEDSQEAVSSEAALVVPELEAIAQALHSDTQFEVLSLYGDAVFRYHIARYLFDKYSQFQEGLLTKITSEALRIETRAHMAELLSLESCVKTDVTPRTLAQALSAVMGKCSVLHGDPFCAGLIQRHYKVFIDLSVVQILSAQRLDRSLIPACAIETKVHNYKNELLEYAQKRRLDQATYSLVKKAGAAHAPTFTVACHFQDHKTTGQGKTIKSAEQDASQCMLTQVKRSNAASVRCVTASSSSHFSSTQVKRFEKAELSELKRNINWENFNGLSDLQEAFTHPSKNKYINYQRLEFLGDALIKKILLFYVIVHYPQIQDKNIVSPRMDQLVSEETQATVARRLNIGQYLFTDSMLTGTLLSDVLEAMIAAIFLDAEKNEINSSERHIATWFKSEIEAIFGSLNKKSLAAADGAASSEPYVLTSNPQSFLNTASTRGGKSDKKKKAKKIIYTFNSFGGKHFAP